MLLVLPCGLVRVDLETMKGGSHMADAGLRQEGAPVSAADLAARFRAHKLGVKLQHDISSQKHQELNPEIEVAVQRVHRASTIADVGTPKATDHFDHVQRSVEYARSEDKLIIASFGTQLRATIQREFILLVARKKHVQSQLVVMVVLGLIAGFLWFQIPPEFSRAFDRTGVILNVSMLAATGVFSTVPLLITDRNVSIHTAPEVDLLCFSSNLGLVPEADPPLAPCTCR
jgi:hypothetical protein